MLKTNRMILKNAILNNLALQIVESNHVMDNSFFTPSEIKEWKLFHSSILGWQTTLYHTKLLWDEKSYMAFVAADADS